MARKTRIATLCLVFASPATWADEKADFHLGGTDAEGYILGAKVGLTRQTWLRLRWLSADEIDGPPLGIDVLQVDLNAKF